MPLPLVVGGMALLGGLAGASNVMASRSSPSPSRSPAPRPASVPHIPAGQVSSIAPDWTGGAAARESERYIAELQSRLNAMPKLPTYNTADAWARANKTATAAVNPVYKDKLNNQLAIYNANRAQKRSNVQRGKQELDIRQRELLEDTGTQRQRTDEDVMANLMESQYQEDMFQTQEGAQFDRANRQARSELASAGLTTSGLGQQELEQQQLDRNVMSADQVRTFEQQRQQQEQFRQRTFEDLDTKLTRGEQLTTRQKQDLDRELEHFLTNIGLEERQFRHNLEQDRLGAILQSTQQTYDSDIRKWIAGLSNQGWRSQDIALAQQVYGR